jgi:hypothetical protein
MKVSEFEAKLGTVSDAKLRQMLSASRARGPEVAVKLILAEGRRRGMGDLEGTSAGEAPSVAMATSAYPKEGAGAFGADAPAESMDPVPASGADPSGMIAPEAAAPALSREWLAEETKSGLPMAVKILLLLAAVGGIAALVWKFTR